MRIVSKALLGAAVLGIGLSTLLVAPASQAAGWHRDGRYHWVNTRVRFRGCRKIVVRKFCRENRRGVRQCRRARRVFWRC